jgi:hypothetical protein
LLWIREGRWGSVLGFGAAFKEEEGEAAYAEGVVGGFWDDLKAEGINADA